MKTVSTLLLLFVMCFSGICYAGMNEGRKDKMPLVEKLDHAPNLFKSGNMFFGGQPNLETLNWLKGQGLDLVINLRSESENEEFAEDAFDEEKAVSELGVEYVSIPIDGYDSYTPESVHKLAKALQKDYKNVLIHCASCGRVSYFMIAYLYGHKEFTLSEAIAFGEQMKFRFPLEYLLEEEIDWTTR